MERIENFLKSRSREGLLRELSPAKSRRPGFRREEDGRERVDFSSNDYLGLSSHPAIKDAVRSALDEFGFGACSSRLLSADMRLFHRLEERIARLKEKEKALLFNSGYQANLGILSALCGRGDVIFSDRLSHASLIDAIRLSGASSFRFRHNDTDHLAWLLREKRSSFKRALIVTETVFSMDGDSPDLEKLAALKEEFDCLLFVDEAHATGIFGPDGAGLVREAGLSGRVDFIMGTFSKALAGFGAYCAASGEAIRFLVNTARSFIYSTALPPAIIAADNAALDCLVREPQRRAVLRENAGYLREKLRRAGFTVLGNSQIVPVVTGDTEKTLRISEELRNRGFWVCPIRPPTVAPHTARLRFSLTYDHDRDILDRLAGALTECA